MTSPLAPQSSPHLNPAGLCRFWGPDADLVSHTVCCQEGELSVEWPMPHRVKTPYTAAHLGAPEITETSNLADVLLWLDRHLEGLGERQPRGVRKGAKSPPDAECHDLIFATAAQAASFKLHWAGEMWVGDRDAEPAMQNGRQVHSPTYWRNLCSASCQLGGGSLGECLANFMQHVGGSGKGDLIDFASPDCLVELCGDLLGKVYFGLVMRIRFWRFQLADAGRRIFVGVSVAGVVEVPLRLHPAVIKG